jgi:hypothetical protein
LKEEQVRPYVKDAINGTDHGPTAVANSQHQSEHCTQEEKGKRQDTVKSVAEHDEGRGQAFSDPTFNSLTISGFGDMMDLSNAVDKAGPDKVELKLKQLASFYQGLRSKNAGIDDMSTTHTAYTWLTTFAPPKGFIKHIKNARYPSLVSNEEVTSFHPGRRYTSTNLKLLRSCLTASDNMIILLDENSELRRATVSIDWIVILDHSNLHGDRN